DFFAPRERMLNPEPAVFIAGKYDEHGKWMDGWESRRKRSELRRSWMGGAAARSSKGSAQKTSSWPTLSWQALRDSSAAVVRRHPPIPTFPHPSA
ncbi:MAG TPA: hypothetical protein VLB05_09110, partial [Dongiaceae bacterium]|nr:hypothetical protein [Dongiaceae bacterium]